MIGNRLGPYSVTAKLGAGGMGEVYRARDTKLERDVAIKVLPAAFAADAERLVRFEREAKLLASLNHSNIAHVYGFESTRLPDGSTVHFLAMELVEGEDLAERLKRGAVPVDEAIGLATQIAEGLEEAHEKGIVHRDLKPANIKLTAGRQGEGPRLRPGEGLDRRGLRDVLSRRVPLPHDDAGYRGRNDPRHRGLHEPGTGAGQEPWTSGRTSGPSAWCSSRC